jgi:hypothetical protein
MLNPAEWSALEQARRHLVLPRHLSRFDDSPLVRPPDHRALEDELRLQLLSKDPEQLRDGLANVLYWLYQLDGAGQDGIWAFRAGARRWALVEALRLLDGLEGPGLVRLEGLKLPGFRDLRSLSALRMFLDPRRYACLSTAHLGLAAEPGHSVIHEFAAARATDLFQPRHEVHYQRWCRICGRLAAALPPEEDWRCADVERALGSLAALGEGETALRLIALGESLPEAGMEGA